MVEQRTENPRVAGSIPALGIFNAITYGPLAQVVEHLTFNQVVRGSSPRWLIVRSFEISKFLMILKKVVDKANNLC